MKQTAIKLIKHPLISGSCIVFVGSLLANILAYIFNLIMGHLLSVSDYGILSTLMSVLSVFSIFSVTLGTVFAKFSASFIAQNKEHLIGKLIKKGNIWVGCLGLLICFGLSMFTSLVMSFLHIQSYDLFYYILVILFFSLLASTLTGILQGLLRVIAVSVIAIFAIIIKLLSGIGLVYIGYRIYGALNAVILSTIFGWVFSFWVLRKFLSNSLQNPLPSESLKKNVAKYAFPVFFSSLGTTLFISIDLIFVKHYFSDVDAGKYAALALMGKAIFYATSPIMFVFFPLLAQKWERKEKLTNTLLLACLMVGIPALCLTSIYFFVPSLIQQIFFPSLVYASLTKYLGIFSIYITLYIFCTLFNNFYLSIGKTYVTASLWMVAVTLEILYFILYHSSIQQIIYGLIGISAVLLAAFLMYYPFIRRNEKR